MRGRLRAFWGALMWTYFVAGSVDPARAQESVAPAPSQVQPPALPTLPRAFPQAPPGSKLPERETKAFAIGLAPAPMCFWILLELATFPDDPGQSR
jgi:hypothetical protein